MARVHSAVMAALVMFVSACAPAAAPAGQAGPAAIAGGTVTVRLTGPWAHIDPQHPTNTAGIQGGQILRSFYDTLIGVGPDGKLTPYLAKSWEQTPTSIKFVLRTDATCADGTKVTPTVVKDSMDRMLKATGAVGRLGKGPWSNSADGAAGTYTFTTQTPSTDAIYQFVSAPIVCPAGLANPDGLRNIPQGSGPYVYESAVAGDNYTVKLRSDWAWGPDGLTAKSPGIPEKIVFKVIDNVTTAANLLTTGGLDLASITGQDLDRLLANKELTNKSIAATQAPPLAMNHQASRPMADKKVREAVVNAIDMEAFNKIVYQGKGVFSGSFLTAGADCFDPAAKALLPQNPTPEKAKKILTDAGWTLAGGKLQKDGKPLAVNIVSTPGSFGAGGEYLQSQLEAAGFTVKLDNLDFNGYLQRLIKGDFDIFPEQVGGETPNPNGAIANFLGPTPPVGANWPYTVNPEAEKELDLARTTVGAERCRHWSSVQRLLNQNFSILPLPAPTTQWFSRGLDFVPAVTGVDVRYIKRVK